MTKQKTKRPIYIDFTEADFNVYDCDPEDISCELGKFDSMAKRVCLRLSHPEVKRAKSSRDKEALIALAKRVFPNGESYELCRGII
jgi:hypothetical protein